ncbi:MAG: hypothetical protein IJI22_02120 [Bacilli bacterium]|nr:hypothetical protein [Bacilli bacterium]
MLELGSSFFFFINCKLHNRYGKDDKYIDGVNNMYENIDDDDIEDLDLRKEKDDYER